MLGGDNASALGMAGVTCQVWGYEVRGRIHFRNTDKGIR